MKRTANNAITFYRDGKRLKIKSGQTFNFTKEEVEDIKAQNPRALRISVDEEVDLVEEKDVIVANTPPANETAAQKKERLANEAKAAKPSAKAATSSAADL